MIEHNLESSNSYIVVKAGNDGKLVRAPSSLLLFFFQGSKRSWLEKEDPLHFFFLIPSRVLFLLFFCSEKVTQKKEHDFVSSLSNQGPLASCVWDSRRSSSPIKCYTAAKYRTPPSRPPSSERMYNFPLEAATCAGTYYDIISYARIYMCVCWWLLLRLFHKCHSTIPIWKRVDGRRRQSM